MADRAMNNPHRTKLRFRLGRFLYKRGWTRGEKYDTWRKRVYDLLTDRHPWYDWGHRLMTVVGQDFGGNWSEPSPPTWYYRLGTPKRMRFTGYPIHPLSTIEVLTSYDEFTARTTGLNEDEMYEWKAICVNQDGDLHLGHQYWGKSFYGLNHWEMPLLARYLRMWRRHDWWGARSWLYKVALNSAVDHKAPFKCNATPSKGSGGYSHWHCSEKRKHKGLHRVGAYVWGDMDGESMPVTHLPVDSVTR